MARLILPRDDAAQPSAPAPKRIHIGGTAYANSAAKFWPGLVDEAADEFAGSSVIRLTWTSDRPLERDSLYPEKLLEQELERWGLADTAREMERTMTELAVFGPPTPVRITVSGADRELHAGELPLDCVDSEVVLFLTAWLLEWAGVPDFAWNQQSAVGELIAEDRERKRQYRLAIDLRNQHLSEGLYQRTLSVTFSLTPLADGFSSPS